ncbi:Vesicle-associated protein 2-1 [Acorus gramineus]|uniref:Vesicle-associated protein 2-1 n=1 Tax=Acorus gramineus TaxID=55184 RepID=A0AAV9BA11_ACOGR|nr:Vesicle-associated protein 2-1 [Acorus gramineus]
MSGSQLITIHPEELIFQVEPEKQCYCDLKVANNTEHHVAFKVKTTTPKKYFVRPNTGVVQPWDSRVVTVTLQAQREYPPDLQCRDKFLLQSTVVPPTTTDIDEIPQNTFNKEGGKEIQELKLRVVYTPATESGNGNSDSYSGVTSSGNRGTRRSSDALSAISRTTIEDVQLIQRLKEEREVIIQQNRQMQQELETLKKRRNRKGETGFSLPFAAFVGLIGITLGFLLNLMFSPPTE